MQNKKSTKKHSNKTAGAATPSIGTPGQNEAILYIRNKVDQLLTVMGTLPLKTEELDDNTLLTLDPIGIIATSFKQILENNRITNQKLEVAHDEIHAILDSAGTAIIVTNEKLEIERFNQKSHEFFFQHIGDVNGLPVCDLLCTQDQLLNRSMFKNVLQGAKVLERDSVQIEDRFYNLVATPLVNKSGEVIRIIFVFNDITDRLLSEKKLLQAAAVFDNAHEGILITNADKEIIAINRAFTEITGYTEEEIIGKQPNILKSGRHDVQFYKNMWEELSNNGYWQGEIWDKTKDGSIIPVWQAISCIRHSNGNIENFVSILSDISTLKQSQEQIDYLAYHDPLTNLPNRLLFNDRLTHALDKSKRDKTKCALLFIDIDRFKTLNDTLGHHFGDLVLRDASRRISQNLRHSDTVARLGGDEFIILIEDFHNTQELSNLCNKLLNAFHTPFQLQDHEIHLSISIGVSTYPEDGDSVESLMKNADAAMYMAKAEGRDSYYFFTRELSESLDEKLVLENALRKALEENQLSLHYQPQIDAFTGNLLGAEALLRWEHPELGFISPIRFIPIAEETGLIVQIGEWVIREAVRQTSAWLQQGLPINKIAINVSGVQLQRSGLPEIMRDVLSKNKIEPNNIELELTESFLMENAKDAVTLLNLLRDLGISMAIDDFGTGYSSLSYLKKLPVNKLKIDRSFVMDITTDKDDLAITGAIIALAKSLNLDVLAEGVETTEQEKILLSQGCSSMQGYFYSKPLNVKDMEAYLEELKA